MNDLIALRFIVFHICVFLLVIAMPLLVFATLSCSVRSRRTRKVPYAGNCHRQCRMRRQPNAAMQQQDDDKRSHQTEKRITTTRDDFRVVIATRHAAPAMTSCRPRPE